MVFPFNFGFIPGTEAEDGYPPDMLVVNEEELVPGCLVKARLVAVIGAKQGNKRGKQMVHRAEKRKQKEFGRAGKGLPGLSRL